MSSTSSCQVIHVAQLCVRHLVPSALCHDLWCALCRRLSSIIRAAQSFQAILQFARRLSLIIRAAQSFEAILQFAQAWEEKQPSMPLASALEVHLGIMFFGVWCVVFLLLWNYVVWCVVSLLLWNRWNAWTGEL